METGLFKTSDGVEIYFEDSLGEGEVLFFMYGLGCNITHWKYQLDYFLNHPSNSYRIVWIDYRGHGKSQNLVSSDQISLDLICGDIAEFFDFRKIKNACLLGQSMGGTISLYFAHLFPDKVDHLIVQGAPPKGPSHTLNMGKIGRVSWLTLIKFNKWNRSLLKLGFNKLPENHFIFRETVRFLGFNPKLARIEDIEEYISGIFTSDPNVFWDLAEDMENFDIEKIDPPIETPTMIIAGEKDMCVSIDQIEFLNKNLENGFIQIVPDGSHCPHLDDPDGVNKMIEDFLEDRRN